MLRITRKTGERVMLGDDVVVEVLEVRGQTVRLGIDAPRSLVIYREEIWLEVKRENEAAAHATGSSMPADLPAPLKGGEPNETKRTGVNPAPPQKS